VSFEETLISVWRQGLVEDARIVIVEGASYSVQRTGRSKLREVNFTFEKQALRGLEQNPNTNSRWATRMRRQEGHAVPNRRAIRCQRRGREGAVLWTQRSR